MMKMSANDRRLVTIIISAVLFIVGYCLAQELTTARLVIFSVALLCVGAEVFIRAGRNILHGQIFDENFLMSIASICAFILGDYPEATAVMLFYQIGEYFQSRAVNRSRRSISELMDIRPDYANISRDGQLEKVYPDEVHVGDTIIIKPGERVPLDAVVIEGHSSVDSSALTGESLPREVNEGDTLLSGCVNINGLLTAQVTKEFAESTASRILDLVENAGAKKSRSENFITKFARYYTPIVVGIAVLLAVIPPLFVPGELFSDWVYRAMVFLVTSCPCALVISVPLGFFGGIGGASRNGVLVKGGNYLEALANTEIVVFDKTGTLTRGVFRVKEIVPQEMSQQELLRIAAYAESSSNHPISLSLREAWGQEIDLSKIDSVEELAGLGVEAIIDGTKVLAGNEKLMVREQIAMPPITPGSGTIVHQAVADKYAGYILIADELKPDAVEAVSKLKASGIKKTVMLTGDERTIAADVADTVGVDEFYAELLPADKVAKVETLLNSKSSRGKLAFVGDGINDAPVLARADIGIAMGGLGSDAAIEAADVVLMTDEPSKISDAIGISKRTLRIVRQNIVFALAVKLVILLLGAVGIASMWAAVFADVGVALLAILNAMRVLRNPLPRHLRR